MTRWLLKMTKGFLILLLLIFVTGIAYEVIGKKQAAQEFPPPGSLVDIGDRHIQLDCRGRGQPTVVFESGLGVEGALSWSLVHDQVAKSTRACTYSRAGIMWSDPHHGVNVQSIVNDLHTTLKMAGEQGPFILVGHSLGGPYIMVYTKYFREEVAGLVFVDASHPEQTERFRALNLPKSNVHDYTEALYQIGAAVNWTGVVRAAAFFYGRLPNQPERDILAMKAYASTSLGAMLIEQDAIEGTLAEMGSFQALGDIPLYVLTGMKPKTADVLAELNWSVEQEKQLQETWRQMHEEQAAWSSNSRHQLVDDAGHYIQFDRPDVVIEAVQWVIENP